MSINWGFGSLLDRAKRIQADLNRQNDSSDLGIIWPRNDKRKHDLLRWNNQDEGVLVALSTSELEAATIRGRDTALGWIRECGIDTLLPVNEVPALSTQNVLALLPRRFRMQVLEDIDAKSESSSDDDDDVTQQEDADHDDDKLRQAAHHLVDELQVCEDHKEEKVAAYCVDHKTGQRIHKASYCAKLSAGLCYGKQSKDRPRRVRGEAKLTAASGGDLVAIGSLCAFYFTDGRLELGRIATLRGRRDKKPLKPPRFSLEKRDDVECRCIWYESIASDRFKCCTEALGDFYDCEPVVHVIRQCKFQGDEVILSDQETFMIGNKLEQRIQERNQLG